MENFDLRKYLADNRLLKEEVDISKISKLGDYNETEDSYKYKDHFVQKYIDGGKTIYAVFKDRGEKTDSYGSPDFESSDLKKVEDFLTENKLLKEEIVFPELEDEFEDTMEAAIERPEVYLQNIIDASDEEIVSDGYFEIKKAVDGRRYTKEKAAELARAWAMAKLSDLIPIDTFLNKNFKEVQDKINKNIPDEAEFKITGDPKVATIAVTDEDGIDISIDKTHMEELFGKNDPENPIITTKINGITVHYNDYL